MPENPAADADSEAARAAHEQWKAARLASVAAPTGNLALIETRWLPAGDETTRRGCAGRSPATVTATELTRRTWNREPERGIRLWDAASPAVRAFETIDVFPFDPAG